MGRHFGYKVPDSVKEKLRIVNTIHGEAVRMERTKEYVAWSKMITRCEYEKFDHYDYYGGRGIIVCKEWRESYEIFLADMGRAPSPKHSLERKDFNGNYCKENCKWATKIEQARNTRTNVLITHNGKTQTMSAWAEELGMDYKKLHSLIKYKGMSLEEAISKYIPPIKRSLYLSN